MSIFFVMSLPPANSTRTYNLLPYTTLCRSPFPDPAKPHRLLWIHSPLWGRPALSSTDRWPFPVTICTRDGAPAVAVASAVPETVSKRIHDDLTVGSPTVPLEQAVAAQAAPHHRPLRALDRKSTRLNSSH